MNVNYLTGATADADTAQDCVLYRCVEIALERGYDGFVVLKGQAYATGDRYGYTTYANITMQMFKGVPSEVLPPETKSEAVHMAVSLKALLEPRIKQ